MAIENTSQDLADLLVTKGFDPVYTDERGMDSSQAEAKIFSFDWKASSGKNYGTAVIVLGEDNDLQFFFGDNLGRSIERPQDKKEWFDFLEQLSNFATQRRHTFSPKDINQLKHTMTGMAAIKEGLFEGYYGTRRISYMGEQTDARLVIKHNKVLGENDKRYRYVESLFIETADNERFKLPFKNLTGGRAMLEHVRQGGKPYDIRGAHINEMVQEMSVLARFNRASQQRVFEGVTAELVESAQHYYQQVRENLNYLGSSRGYRSYFESWTPADIGDETALVEDLKTMFIEQTLDTRIEAALPTLARIQQRGNAMKEAQIFENWINNLAEGTWALPDTPEAQEKLNTLMGSELIVGPDATNATELLYDVIGDDQLFDILGDLAERDPRANIWDDTDVQARLAELGIQTPQSTQTEPADVAQDTAPAQQGVAETGPAATAAIQQGLNPTEVGIADRTDKYNTRWNAINAQKAQQMLAKGLDPTKTADWDKFGKQGMAENTELNTMLKYAGVPVKESVLTDSTGHTLGHILQRFSREVADFEKGGDLDQDLYEALYDYYFDDMPYGTKKARDGDPYEWVSERLADELGVNESNSGMVMPEADPMDTFEVMSGFDAPAVHEGSCNSTMEGEYCPEHGLAECAMEETMGKGSQLDEGSGEFQYFRNPTDPNYHAAIETAGYTRKSVGGGTSPNELILDAQGKPVGYLMNGYGAIIAPSNQEWVEFIKTPGAFHDKLDSMWADEAVKVGSAMAAAAPKLGISLVAAPLKAAVGVAGHAARQVGQVAGQAVGAVTAPIKAIGRAVTAEGSNDDPMNYNAAITGSYYESREGDATLARIKSLALLK